MTLAKAKAYTPIPQGDLQWEEFVDIRIDPENFEALMRTLSRTSKEVGIGLQKVRSKAAGMIRTEALTMAPVGQRGKGPRGGSKRGRFSTQYGPLSNKRRNVVYGDLRRWGVTAPFYYRFIERGYAGSARVTPRPYYQRAEERTRAKRNRVVRDGIVEHLRIVYGDTPALRTALKAYHPEIGVG